jgi:hypothetical protein
LLGWDSWDRADVVCKGRFGRGDGWDSTWWDVASSWGVVRQAGMIRGGVEAARGGDKLAGLTHALQDLARVLVVLAGAVSQKVGIERDVTVLGGVEHELE